MAASHLRTFTPGPFAVLSLLISSIGSAAVAADEVEGLKTFSQSDWGAGKNADAKATDILDRNFDKTFKDGLMVGKRDKGLEHYVIASPDEVRRLLPISGSPGVLKRTGDKQSLLDCGGLAGQLVAAKLNVGFDSKGELGKRKDKGEPPLRKLVLKKGVQRSLQGMQVQDLIGLSDRAIGGEFGQKLKPSKKAVDVDGDEDADVSLMDLREALRTVNATYRAGRDVGRGLDVASGKGETSEDEEEEIELTDEEEKELEGAEEERDDEILTAEQKRNQERRRIARIEAEKGESKELARERKKADDEYRARKTEIDRKFEEKEARFRSEWRERHGRAHPGKGKGLKGEHPGQGKGQGKGKGKKG